MLKKQNSYPPELVFTPEFLKIVVDVKATSLKTVVRDKTVTSSL